MFESNGRQKQSHLTKTYSNAKTIDTTRTIPLFLFSPCRPPPPPPPKNKKRIIKTYAAVGIAEEWELSMALFNATVQSPVRQWNPTPVHDAGSTSAFQQEVLEWACLSPEIHTVLSADMLLYDLSLAIFKNQTNSVLGTVWD